MGFKLKVPKKISVSAGSALPVLAGGLTGATVGLIDRSTGSHMTNKINDVAGDLGKYNPYAKTDVGGIPDVVKPREIDKSKLSNPDQFAVDVDDSLSPFRKSQLGLINRLQGQVDGTAPSLAALQAQETMNQGMAQQFAMANSARGGNNAALGRQAMMSGSDMAAQMTSQSAMARLAEQQSAAGLLGQVSGQGRQVDAQIQVERAKQKQAHRELTAKYAQMGLDADKAMVMADLDVQRMSQAGALGTRQMEFNAAEAQKAKIAGLVSKVGEAGMAYATGGASTAATAGSDLAADDEGDQDLTGYGSTGGTGSSAGYSGGSGSVGNRRQMSV